MKYKILLLLFAIIIIVSSILSFVPIDKACKQKQGSCEIVNTSQYESTFGIKNSHLGLTAFLILFILTASQIKKPTKTKKQLIGMGLILGSAYAIYFMIIQFFVLHATCFYCLTADIATIISLIVFFGIKGKIK
jgi:uncharacterized membrane protein